VNKENRLMHAYADDAYQHLQAPVQLIYGQLLIVGKAALSDTNQNDFNVMNAALGELSDLVQSVRDDFVSADKSGRSNLRHDMRNAIGVILGYAELILEDVGEEAGSLSQALMRIEQEANSFLADISRISDQALRGDDGKDLSRLFDDLNVGDKTRDVAAAPGTILVVDDNASNRALLMEQLRRQGHTVTEATCGLEGLELMQSHAPDLVLLDLLMPDMSGYEVLQAIRSNKTLRRIPVVMISGLQDEQGAVRCIESGASDYLIKPVNPTLLRARVSALIERKRWADKERHYLLELEKSRDFIRNAFGRYVSDTVVQRLLDDQDGLELGGKTQCVTILMCDIRGFSEISRDMPPQDCVKLLNNYLGEMAEIIMSYGGTINEFIGDGILAMFGAPLTSPDDANNAVACALAMQLAIVGINEKNQALGLPAVAIGIGINTGDVVVVNIGSEKRSQYGAVGHSVNLASRVEGCTVGGQVLISEYTLAALTVEVTYKKALEARVKGQMEPLNLFDVSSIKGSYDLVLLEFTPFFRACKTDLVFELILATNEALKVSSKVLGVDVRAMWLELQPDVRLSLGESFLITVEGLSRPMHAKTTREVAGGIFYVAITSATQQDWQLLMALADI
jgi:class 3 adenylate cyclase/CheY-like chemotaxis protein